MSLLICLRDVSSSPARFIVEVSNNLEEADDRLIEGFLKKFVKEVEKKMPIKEEKVDVYFGLYLIQPQASFKIPKEFFDLVSRNGWDVEMNIN